MEKYRDGQRELHSVFVDLEKVYDRVPREELWYCMRKSGVAEKYVRVVQDMYERSRTVVRCAVGQTEELKVEVGLHQGSALSPFLFAIVMDQLSEEVRQESPWTMMFADDIVICSESREQVEENLERWRFALERRGMKVSRSKTEYMCVNEREGSGTVRLQGEEVKKVQEFKYLGSIVQSNGECAKEPEVGSSEIPGDSVMQKTWRSGTVPLDWATGVVVPLFKKGDRRVCSNYRGITLLSLPGKVYSRVLERRVRPLVEPRIQEEQCGFRPSRGTLDQLYTLHRVLEGSWEFAQPVHMCFVDLEKAFDRVPRGILWEVLWEYGVHGPLLRAVRSLYNRSRSLVRIASCKSDLFPVHVGLRQGCPLSPVLFIVFMDRISRRSQGLVGVRFGDHRISSLIFADDVVLLASSGLDLQHALGRFAAECEAAGMRVSTSKSEAMVLDRKKVACTLQVGGEVLPQVE
ncbi:hypothetical protein QTP86_018762 [Hemibagrus guttatus]|nr:hypothetical protein QTP86_018762 [Hemibagrus guttatus]